VKCLGYLAIAVTLFLVAVKEYKPFNHLFASMPAVAIGKVSYGLYVYHLPIFFYFGVAHVQPGRINAPPETAATAALVLAAVVVLSWFLMEKPFLSLKKELVSSPSEKQTSSPARANKSAERT
jgi:peptidoglycan/LPS O-acetylase OafA/YrhL